jgi:sucrose-6-phosphate hydrolase SacC (GH32 family)
MAAWWATSVAVNTGDNNFAVNTYESAIGTYKYTNADIKSVLYRQNAGEHAMMAAGSGTAGNTITFNTMFVASETEVVVNEAGVTATTRIESADESNALSVSGQTGTVRIDSLKVSGATAASYAFVYVDQATGNLYANEDLPS